ncbi:NrsF family protein [Archangium lansingense]|uniref:NrsF family protein n=1 Tax=Archangium lansingense TaxID=2995310 RepID=A0ABT4AIW9_9BACT|nr:NrsF family protein [Archangium lansinium]MCY1081648.1 NrsF family protein [Archangium lansinium]
MTPECSRVLDSLEQPLPPELVSHVAECAECGALLEGFGALENVGAPTAQAAMPALERVRTLTQEELAAHPKPTPWWREVLVLVGVYVGMTVLGALAFTPLGLMRNAAPPGIVVGLAVLVLLVMLGGAIVALAPVRRVAWGLVGTCTAVVALSVLLGGSGLAAKSFLAGVIGCTRVHMLLSALPLLAALVMLRRSAYHPVRAVAAGLSAGAVGLLLLNVHCADGSAAHLAASHVGPWLLLGGLALLVRSRLPTSNHAP